MKAVAASKAKAEAASVAVSVLGGGGSRLLPPTGSNGGFGRGRCLGVQLPMSTDPGSGDSAALTPWARRP